MRKYENQEKALKSELKKLAKLEEEKKEWTKCVRVNQNTIQSLHGKIVIINKLTDELHYERQRNKKLVTDSDQCQTDLGQCQSAYNSTEKNRLDCENSNKLQTLTINDQDNQISKLREQLNACDQRVGNCDRQLTSSRDQLMKSENAHQQSEVKLTNCKSSISSIRNL